MALPSWQTTIVDENGTIQPTAQVEVIVESTGALAPLYSDRDGTSAMSNPVAVGADAFVRFYTPGAALRVRAFAGAFERIWRHVPCGLLGERDFVTAEFIDSIPDSALEYERTAAEISAGVTPTNYVKAPLNVLRYGTTWDAIQLALNVANAQGGGTVYLPAARYTKGTANKIDMRSNVRLVGDGFASEIFVPDGATFIDNVLKFEAITKSSAEHIRINGNRANSGGGTRYGFYLGGCDQCALLHVFAHANHGDGLHFYDCDNCIVHGCISYDNRFHGLELEQCRDTVALSNQLYQNDNNGLYVFEGEVGASGSHGIAIVGNSIYDNTDYGMSIQGPLSDEIVVSANSVRSNGEYGIAVFDRIKGVVVSSNVVALNGFTGIYLWRIQGCSVVGNRLRNNSQASNGAYQEIHLDGDATQYSAYNTVIGNSIEMSATAKSAYGIKENSVSDGPNIIMGNVCPLPGSSGTIAPLHETGAQNSFLLTRFNLGRASDARGVATFNGTGAQTAFVIAHGLAPDEPRNVQVSAGSPNASGARSIAVDSTNITVTFLAAPTAGTGNVVLRWMAES